MSRQIVTSLGRLLLLVVLVGAAAYVGLSMYRWEWQRAIFAFLVFLGALVLVLFLVLLRRLDRLDRRMADLQATAGQRTGSGRGGVPYGVSAEPADDFSWLGPPPGTYVFLPLLLGFGVLVSLLAVAVERISGFVVGGPRAGGNGNVAAGPGTPGLPWPRARTAGLAVAAFILAVLLTGLLIPAAGEFAYDPEEPEPGRREMDVAVSGRRVDVHAADTVGALAVYCREQMQAPIVIDEVEVVEPQLARLTVHPRLAPAAQRRYEGCLGDLIMDRHLTGVVAVRDVPG